MARFFDTPVTWDGAERVHVALDCVWERSSKFVRCGERIGANARYGSKAIGISCADCLAQIKREQEQGRYYGDGRK